MGVENYLDFIACSDIIATVIKLFDFILNSHTNLVDHTYMNP